MRRFKAGAGPAARLYPDVMSKQPGLFRDIRTPQSKAAEPPAPESAKPVEVPPKLDPSAAAQELPPERGGYTGPEPTRFGDWEHKGRCTDF